MADIDIDSSLIAYLGLPADYQLDKLEAFKIYSYLKTLSGIDSPVDAGRLEYYVDKHGDFINKPKNKRDYIIKAVFENMDKYQQFSVLSYIEYWHETNGFTEFDNDTE